MSKQELTQFIASFGKKPGEYSVEEIIQIGIKFKQLNTADKRWSDLVDILGWPGSSSSLRSYIGRKIAGISSPKPLASASDNSAAELKDIVAQREALFKIKQQNYDNMTAYRRLLRDDARIDSFKDVLQKAAEKAAYVGVLPVVTYTGPVDCLSSSKEEAILMFSDLHIGVDCNNFYNTYNIEVAKKRVQVLVDNTIQYCLHFGVKKLNIVNLGDLILGLIHVDARIEQQVDTVEQVMIASEILAEALNKLQAAAPEVVYRSCTDNHSRVVADKTQHIEKDSFCKIIDWYLEARLKDSGIKFVKDNLDDSIGKFELENGKKVAFVHGHLDNINSVFQGLIGATKEFLDYVLLSHFHSEKEKQFQGMKIFVNGSIVGTEQYALSKRLFSSPAQTLLIFDSKNVVDISISLDIK